MKYSIGLQISDLKLVGYSPLIDRRRKYIFQCKCGKHIEATTTSISRMYKTLDTHGHIACMNCTRKEKALKKANSGGEYRDVYVRYKKGAKNRQIVWDLSYDTAKLLFSSYCVYCGDAPQNTYSRSKYYKVPYNGIDRVDSSKGYTIDNVVSCCRICNMAKAELSVDQFFKHIKQIYDFQRLERKLVGSSEPKQEGPI